jgi:hypothetical protein
MKPSRLNDWLYLEDIMWQKFLCFIGYHGVRFRHYDAITFRNGYAKDAPQFTIECQGIDIRNGREKWGAEKGKFYFVLQLGRIIDMAIAV